MVFVRFYLMSMRMTTLMMHYVLDDHCALANFYEFYSHRQSFTLGKSRSRSISWRNDRSRLKR
jgi:hypothetical protein